MIPFAPFLCRSCRILNQGERERERIERSLKSNPHPCHVDTLLIAKISTAIYTQTGQELEKLLNYNRQDTMASITNDWQAGQAETQSA